MAVVKKAMRAGAKAGKKVLATDAGQSVVGTVVDTVEEIVVDKADDVADTVKARAAKAGGRSPRKQTGRKKTSARKKTAARKSPARKKTTARYSGLNRCADPHPRTILPARLMAAMLSALRNAKRSPETGGLSLQVVMVAGACNPLNLEFSWTAA